MSTQMVFRRLPVVITLGVALLASTPRADAQSLRSQLSTLLTEQVPDPVFVPNVEAAAATREALSALFAVELAGVPVASSSGGFVYRLNPRLGVVERASNSFGPFYTESVLQNARRQTGLGVRFQSSKFTSLQGADLTTGTFPTNATRVVGATQPFSVDTLQLSLDARTVSFIGNYGVTDRLSIGATLPFQTVRFSGQRFRTLNGVTSLQSTQSGSGTGLGDALVQARYGLLERADRGMSLGGDFRLPTGREDDLLGSGKAAGRLLAIGSVQGGPLALHANAGIGLGGLSREYFFSTATTFAVTDRVTVIGEVIGRRLAELNRLQDVYEPYPQIAGTETMRWLPVERGINTSFVVAGAKWNVARSVLLNSSVMIRLTDGGLRARVTPTISLDFDFQR